MTASYGNKMCMKDQKNKKKYFHKTLTIHYNMFIKKEIALIILERKKQRKQGQDSDSE